jgi:hypothetical protein
VSRRRFFLGIGCLLVAEAPWMALGAEWSPPPKFVWVKINYSKENKNEALLSRDPKIKGYPHLFVLDGDGKLLHSQDTDELEEGKSYDLDRFHALLRKWSGDAA